MFYVYVLLSQNEDYYVGYTSNLDRRVREHNEGLNVSTKGRKWELVYYEAFFSKQDAVIRERKLKQRGQTKRHLKQRIQCSVRDVLQIIC